MRDNIPDYIIEKGVALWCDKLFNPRFDNGDTSDSGFFGMALATINSQNDKDKITDMEARVEVFRVALTEELKRLRDTPGEYFPAWLAVDYGPCRVLAEAANKAGIPYSQFSCKSSVLLSPDRVSTSFGYGAGSTFYYKLKDAKWLVTDLSGGVDMDKVFESVQNGNPLGLTVDG